MSPNVQPRNQIPTQHLGFSALQGRVLGCVIFLTAFVVVLPDSRAQTSPPPLTREPPLWFAKPQQFGYDASVFRKFHPLVGGERVKIQFLDDHRLALAWLTPDDPTQNPIPFQKSIPSHLHLLVVDAHTGKKSSHHEWACSSAGVNLAYTPSGEWLVSSDESVILYSPSFDDLRHLDAVRANSTEFVSPSGRTFLSYASNSRDASSGQLRDSATFDVVDSWSDSRVGNADILYSDGFLLADIRRPGTTQQLYIREIGGNWNLYPPSVDYSPSMGPIIRRFLDEGTIVSLLLHELMVETVGRTELFRSAFPQRGLYPSLRWASSRTGTRFALILDRSRGIRNEFLDVYPSPSDDRVIVYSVPQKSAIFSVKVRGVSPRSWGSNLVWNGIALSPDGLLLTIVSNDGIRVFALPPEH